MNTESELNVMEHLEELRRRLLIALAGVAFLSLISYFASDAILQFLMIPIRPFQRELYFMTPYEAFLVKLEVAFLAGLILAAPLIWLELWLFVAPGLYPHEKQVVLGASVLSTVFFAAGVLFAFYAVIPFALKFLLGFQSADLKPLLSVKRYISFIGFMMLGFGVAFDLPVLILGLVKLRLLTAATLAKQRRVMIVLILILAAILTPSPDIFSQLLLAVPLWILLEFCVAFARLLEKRESPEKVLFPSS